MKRKIILFSLLLSFFLLTSPQTFVYAKSTDVLIYRGTHKLINAPFEIPNGMMRNSKKHGFPVGLLTGTLEGTMRAVGGLVFGAVDVAVGVLPYAKYAAFFI